MNEQKIFNRIAKHMLTQGCKAGYFERDFEDLPVFECQYRITVDNGGQGKGDRKVLKCAIGCLIPFSNYSPEIEGASVTNYEIYSRFPKSLKIVTHEDHMFLYDLQKIHDDKDPLVWPDELERFARVRGLNSDVVTTIT